MTIVLANPRASNEDRGAIFMRAVICAEMKIGCPWICVIVKIGLFLLAHLNLWPLFYIVSLFFYLYLFITDGTVVYFCCFGNKKIIYSLQICVFIT